MDDSDRPARSPRSILAQRPDRAARPRKQVSLLARALSHLARLEHSRVELARKLAPHADSADSLEQLLDSLTQLKLLSDARFVEVLARSRAERFGAARIRQELRSHQIDPELSASTVSTLKASEFERARALWQRRFGTAAATAAERARQMRFLAGRGFASEVIRKVVSGADDDE